MIEHLFDCAICRRPVNDYPHRRGPDRQIGPVCRYCESGYRGRAPMAGAFMDRRKAIQVLALAEALSGEAHAKRWEGRYGYS